MLCLTELEPVRLSHRAAVKCLVDEHNTIMVTWANHHYLDFVMNWVEHVKGVGVTAYLVGAMVSLHKSLECAMQLGDVAAACCGKAVARKLTLKCPWLSRVLGCH